MSEQLAAAARHTGWPTGFVDEPRLEEIGWGAPHDLLDAYLSAWVAALDESQRFSYGNPPNDVIWIPSVSVPQWPDVPRAADPKSSQGPRTDCRGEPRKSTERVLLCPVCGVHPFKRWPCGWGAHATHTCAALTATDPAERKLEYRRRYSKYFRPTRHSGFTLTCHSILRLRFAIPVGNGHDTEPRSSFNAVIWI